MKCPHCKKCFEPDEINHPIKRKVFNEILKREHSISSLSKKLSIKRSTLVYYLDRLAIEERIVKVRIDNKSGRPNIIKPKTPNFYATKPLSSQREESTKLHKRTL
jgi:predicted transcriptional regulator